MAYGGIQLERARGHHVDRLRTYAVLIDGARVGGVRQGETSHYVVAPGTHVVRLRAGRRASAELYVEVEPRGVVTLSCRPQDDPLTAVSVLRSGRIALALADPVTPRPA